jgi:hypothetical protein
MIRLFCATNHCTAQAAELCHAAQREAALRAQLAAVTAERDALAAQNTALQEQACGALEGKLFYEEMYCEMAKAARRA